MTEKDVLRYLALVDRKLTIYINSGINWKPEYEDELTGIDKELSQLRILVDAEHSRRRKITFLSGVSVRGSAHLSAHGHRPPAQP